MFWENLVVDSTGDDIQTSQKNFKVNLFFALLIIEKFLSHNRKILKDQAKYVMKLKH